MEPSIYEILNAPPPPEVLTSDFVIRSLRRRLWKAFQQDDVETALRAYQASLEDFERWLEEEETMRRKAEEQADIEAGKSAISKEKKLKRKISKTSRKKASGLKNSEKEPDISLARSISAGPILQSMMNPSEPFIADDFLSPYDVYSKEIRKELPDLQEHEREKLALARKRSRKARLAAFNIFRSSNDEQALAIPGEKESDTILRGDINMTTPLHEAARIGAGDFIRILLANNGDPNVKNGHARTALHLCSGGVTAEEYRLTKARSKRAKKNNNYLPIGIKAPVIPPAALALMLKDLDKTQEKKGTARKAARAVGKIFQSAIKSPNKHKPAPQPKKKGKTKLKADPTRLDQIVTERMDAALALLSWNHLYTGDGPSINAVDGDGRTALHYAAEMGRSDVCMAILSNFGAMLTVVDELGSRTPCELAALRGFKDLAAQLEARALLYIDPYGLDDELMASVLSEIDFESSNPRKNLVAPFSWYQTISTKDVGEERAKRLKSARSKMSKAFKQWNSTRDMKTLMASAARVGLSAAMNIESDDDDIDEDNNYGDNSSDDKNISQSESIHDKESHDKPDDMKSLMASAEKVGLNVALGIKEDKHEVNDAAETKGNVTASDKEVKGSPKTLSNLQDMHIERFLSFHKWNVPEATQIFRQSPAVAFQNANIPLPCQANPTKEKTSDSRLCLICYDDDVGPEKWVTLSGCIHGFCSDCLKDYVKDCAASKMAVMSITCPHHECQAGISQEDIDSLLSDEPAVSERIAEANNEHFISSAYDYAFCTHPGCPGVVKKAHLSFLTKHSVDPSLVDYTGAVCTRHPSNNGELIGDGCTLTYEGVEDLDYTNCRSLNQPRKAHRFCFGCGEDVHWPVSCESLQQWKEKMREEINEVEDTSDNTNELAQKMWIKANTKPCPQCNVPIEKNDGCNHMTCTNPSCRHEFCWICRKEWSLHGTETGGFFRCNIWREEGEGPPSGKGDALSNSNDPQGFGTAIHSAREQWQERQRMARFLHHYTRWNAHGESATLERKMCDTVCSRLAPVVEAAIDFDGSPTFNFGGKGLSFVHSAFTELLECRSVLKHSYAFSFFRYPAFYQFRHYGQLSNRRREKTTFERLQSELEIMTEQMSDIVARSHLRATKVQITFLTSSAAERRNDFTNLMFSILNEERKETKLTRAPKSLGINVISEGSVSQRHRNDGVLPSPLDEFMSRAQLDPTGGNENHLNMWACSACTYMNSGGFRCAICGHRR